MGSVPNGIVSTRWFWYLLSLFMPLSGILIALFLYDHNDRASRKVGRNCLLIGFLIWVLFPCLLLMAFFFLAAVALIGWVTSLMPTD